jgi:hypothetical protein
MQKMGKFVTALALATMLIALAPTVAATKPTPISGTLSGTVANSNLRMAGPNFMVSGTYTIIFSRALNGTCTGSAHLEVHFTGSTNIEGSCAFTGTASVGGKSGTGEAMVTFSGKGNALDLLSLAGQVHFVIVGVESTGLSGLHGVGSASASGAINAPFTGAYTLDASIE